MPLRYLDKCLRWALVVLFLTMTGVSFLQVVARYGFNNALPWPDELSRYLMVYVVFVGAGVAMADRTHFRVDFLVDLLPRRARLTFEAAGYLVGVPFLIMFGLQSLPLVEKGWTQMAASVDIPIAYAYLALPLGAALMALNAIRGAWPLLAAAWRSQANAVASEGVRQTEGVAEVSRL